MVSPAAVRLRSVVMPTVRASIPTFSLLQETVLATVVYHDLLSLPLTVVELWRYLLRPRNCAFSPPTLSEVEDTVAMFVTRGSLVTEAGYVLVPGKPGRVAERLDRHALAQEKWRRLRRVAWWLQAIPFLRMVAGSGSLAREFVRDSSDLDVLVIAETGRIWTVRFLLTVLLDLCRIRRRPTGPTKDLVCLNHYLALGSLHIPYQSVYTAYEYARLVPLMGEDICAAFRSANRAWLLTYLARVFPDRVRHRKTVRTSRLLGALQRGGEGLLRGRVGDGLERALARLQMRRIARGEESLSPGRVVATSARLEFHPHSHEAPILAAFNRRMADLGLDRFGGQQDSGLVGEE